MKRPIKKIKDITNKFLNTDEKKHLGICLASLGVASASIADKIHVAKTNPGLVEYFTSWAPYSFISKTEQVLQITRLGLEGIGFLGFGTIGAVGIFGYLVDKGLNLLDEKYNFSSSW